MQRDEGRQGGKDVIINLELPSYVNMSFLILLLVYSQNIKLF